MFIIGVFIAGLWGNFLSDKLKGCNFTSEVFQPPPLPSPLMQTINEARLSRYHVDHVTFWDAPSINQGFTVIIISHQINSFEIICDINKWTSGWEKVLMLFRVWKGVYALWPTSSIPTFVDLCNNPTCTIRLQNLRVISSDSEVG